MSQTTTLNPNAPEYKRLSPGIYPSPDSPLPFSFCKSNFSAISTRHPPLVFQNQLVSCIPSIFITPYNTYSSYHLTLFPIQNRNASAGPRQQPQAVVQAREPGRRVGVSRGRGRGRGFRGGRGNGRDSCLFVDEGNRRRRVGLKSVGTTDSETRNNESGGSRKGDVKDKHRVMPLTRSRDQDKTTVMIKNVPYNCPRGELMDFLDGFCLTENSKVRNLGEEAGGDDITAYDFVYLPFDFKTKKSRGFAFVNFTNAGAVWKFLDAFHMKKWNFNEWNKWPKRIEIVRAKIQGKEALVNHFSNSIFECETNDFLPVCFQPARDGSGNPCQLTVVGIRRPIIHREGRGNHKV